MRNKVAANSPYATGFTDTRDFSDTNGEVLDASEHIALADDLQALADRIAAVPVIAVPDGVREIEVTSGTITIPAAQISLDGSYSPLRNGKLEWVKIGSFVSARFKVSTIIGTGNSVLNVSSAWLFSQGLPVPRSTTLSPVTDFPRAVPLCSQIGLGSGFITPIKSLFDPDDDGSLKVTAASSNWNEVLCEFTYQATGNSVGDISETLVADGAITKRYTFFSAGAAFTLADPVAGARFTFTNVSGADVVVSFASPIGNEPVPAPTDFTLYSEESLDVIYDGTYWRIL